jgi:hypothetical protein
MHPRSQKVKNPALGYKAILKTSLTVIIPLHHLNINHCRHPGKDLGNGEAVWRLRTWFCVLFYLKRKGAVGNDSAIKSRGLHRKFKEPCIYQRRKSSPLVDPHQCCCYNTQFGWIQRILPTKNYWRLLCLFMSVSAFSVILHNVGLETLECWMNRSRWNYSTKQLSVISFWGKIYCV